MGRSGRCLLLVSSLVLVTGSIVASEPARGDAAQASQPSLPTAADVAVNILQPGTSAKSVRETARASLPLQQLSAEHQKLPSRFWGT